MPVSSYKLSEIYDNSAGQIYSATLSKDIPTVYAIGGERDVKVYSVEAQLTGNFISKKLMSFQGHNSSINSLCFNDSIIDSPTSPKSKSPSFLASGSFSGTIRSWDLEAGKSVTLTGGHTAAISSLCYYYPPKYLLSGSLDCTVRMWDVRRRGALSIYKGHRDRITQVKFSPDGEWFISASADNTIRMYDLRTQKILKTWEDYSNEESQISGVNFVNFHPNDMIIAGNFGKATKIIELENFEIVDELKISSKIPRCSVFHPDKSVLFNIFDECFETHVWEPCEKLNYNKAEWGFPVSAAICKQDDALRVLSMSKNKVELFTVSLGQVNLQRKTDNFDVISPRKTFTIKQDVNISEISDTASNNSKQNVEQNEKIEVFAKIPKNVVKVDISPEPGEILNNYKNANIQINNQQQFVNLDDQPKNYKKDYKRDLKSTTDEDLLKYISSSNDSINDIFNKRINNFDQILAQWSTGDIVSTARLAISLSSNSAIIDLLNLIVENNSVWNLELAATILPELTELLKTTYKETRDTANSVLDLILRQFNHVIVGTLSVLEKRGAVDLQLEKRIERCSFIRDLLKNKIYPLITTEKHKFLINQLP